MNDGHSSSGSPERSWLEKLAMIITGEPKNRQELLHLIRDAQSRNLLNQEALDIIEGALQLSDMKVRDIMIPRSQLIAVKASESPQDFLPRIIESGHSRFPVFSADNPDEVLGILLAKDLLPLALENRREKFSLKDILRPAVMVPESKRLDILLKDFKDTHNHMAVVLNEYGGIAGVVTIEDVLEQIVGEIEDETDIEEEDYLIKQQENNRFIVKALTPVEDFNDFFSTQLSDEEFDTIGGVVLKEFGHLPSREETIHIDRFQFKVLNSDSRSIRLLEVEEIA